MNSSPLSVDKTARKKQLSKKNEKAGFSQHLATPSGDGEKIIPTVPLSALETVLALQGINEDSPEQKVISKGHELLDILSTLQADILKGSVSKNKLKQMINVIEKHKISYNNPKLNEIIDAIELRARVEYAKYS
jgi:class II flagellar assembly regulator FliX